MKNVLAYLILGILLIEGCNFSDLDFQNLEGPTITSNSAIPLGHVRYTVRELIDEVGDSQLELQEDSTSLLYLVYRDTAQFSSGTDIINIGNISQSVSFELPETPPVLTTTIIPVQKTFTLNYEPDKNEELTEVYYSQGNISFVVQTDLTSTYTYTSTLTNTVQTVTENPIVFTESSANTSSLIDHKSTFTFENDSNKFIIDLAFDITLEMGDSIPAGTTVTLNVDYTDQEFYLLYGRFGQDTINVGSEVLEVSFFEDLGESGFAFGNPTFTFDFVNSFGINLGILFEGLYGVEGTGAAADTIYLEGSITQTPQAIFGPSGAEEVGQSLTTQLKLDSDNSSIRELLATSPNQIGFSLSAIANPFDKEKLNFVLDTSRITTYIEAVLPLELQLENVTRDIDFDLGGGLKFDETDSLTLRVISVNEIPFSVLLDLEIYDENDSLLFVAADHRVIETPFLNIDGSLKQARKRIDDIPMNEQGIEALNKGKRLNLRVTLNTPESRNGEEIYVDILADYALDIQISAVGTLKVNL